MKSTKLLNAAILSLAILPLGACTGGAPAEDVMTSSESGAHADTGSGAAVAQADTEAAAGGVAAEGKLPLGRLESEDLRKLIHAELEKRITKSASVGDGAEEATELGDADSFQYTVVKLSRGPDDVSGDPTEVPDGVEVEVNGWYKKSLAQKAASGPEVTCRSFDTVARLVKRADRWVVPTDYQVVFNREDNEDCY